LERYPHDVDQTFADKTLLPGFVDPHQHPLVGGAALCLPTPDEPLVAWGYDAIALGGPLTNVDLDAVSATRQVIVWDASEHDMFANSSALRARNVTRESTRIAGVEAGPDGEPNGHFAGKPASLTFFADVLQSSLQPERATKIM